MGQFPHLKFQHKVQGKPRYRSIGGNERTKEIRKNRQGHSAELSARSVNVKAEWKDANSDRDELKLAYLDEEIVPIFLQINPELLNDYCFDLQNLGIEIISEEENGFIIGASLDNLRALEEKIKGFVTKEHGSGKIANIWAIIDGSREDWRPEHILSEDLYRRWHEIKDDQVFHLEVGIAFDQPMGKEPDPTKKGGESRLCKYRESLLERDEKLRKRESDFERFINHYGQLTSGFVDLQDSFSCEIEISGKGLRDLVLNYQFVFEVSEIDVIAGDDGADTSTEALDLEVLPPDEDATEVAVIDSGIMENHRYIQDSIVHVKSKSYVIGDSSTADLVGGGGHGTKVAGAILYPNGVSHLSSKYQLPCFIRNLKILDGNNRLNERYPAELIRRLAEENSDCMIFNLSINSSVPSRKKHMSAWAAVLDGLIHERNILFVVSAGNISKDLIRHYLSDGFTYPDYLQEPSCAIANPAQSSFAITVGSINTSEFEDENWKSLGKGGQISGYSRIGLGLWGHVKPDVVEYGGDLMHSKNSLNTIRENDANSPELIRSTLNGGPAFGRDSVGTSFSAPKISNIVAHLSNLYPEEGANLVRALLIQGARLPNEYLYNPTREVIQCLGYGLPTINRVLENSENRITFYNTGKISALEGHIYLMKIPEELAKPDEEFDILIEVTLAYTAKVRRTRQKTKSYLSTWLDWNSSKIGETYAEFRDYALREIEGDSRTYDRESRLDLQSFDWRIKTRRDHGNVQGVNRNNSTVQKDWTIIKSHQLPEEISLIVRGHQGWDRNNEEVPYSIAVSLEVLQGNIEIYESIKVLNEIDIPIRV